MECLKFRPEIVIWVPPSVLPVVGVIEWISITGEPPELLDELESPESNEAFLPDMISPPSMHDVIESRSGICPITRALLGAGLMRFQDITRLWATTDESLRGKYKRSKVGVDVK